MQLFCRSTCRLNQELLDSYSLVPRPARRFGCTKERGGPGMFPHVRDVEGRKVVERT